MALMIPTPRTFSGRRFLQSSFLLRFVMGGLLSALLGHLSEAQNAPANTPTLLKPAESLDFRIDPNEHGIFLVEAEARTAIRISFEQTREMLSVVWSSGGEKKRVPRTNDAGLNSAIRFSVVSNDRAEEKFEVSCLHVQLACAGIVTVSAARPASGGDVAAAAEEESLAEAEDIRRHGDKSSWPIGLQKFRAAAEFFQGSGDGTLRRAALNGEARLLLYKLSDYRAARDAAITSTMVDTGETDRQGQGLAWKTLSSAEYFLGDYAAGIEAAQKAIALYKQTGDDYWQGILLGNLAYTFRETGDLEHALESSEQALAIARRIQDKYGVAFNLEALATVHLSRGELEPAFEFYYQALDATRVQPYPSVEAAIWSGLGDLYSDLNDEKRAEECFQKALPLTKSASDTAGMLKVISRLGELYLRQGRGKDALVTLREGQKQAKNLGLVREQSLLSAAVARSEAALGDLNAARLEFQSAVDAAAGIANKDAEANALLHFGDFEYSAGDSGQAGEFYARAYDLWAQESNRAQAAIALASLARLDSDAGDLQKARQEIEDALGFFEDSRATLASRELRTTFFSSKHAYYDLAISILMRLHGKDPAQGHDAEAFAIAERASSRALLDELGGGNVPTFLHAPTELVREQKDSQARLDAMFVRLRSLSDEPQKNSEQIAKVRVQIEEQLRASDTLEARMQAASGEYAALSGAQPAISAEIADHMEERAALAKYWVGKDATYLWLTTHDGFHSFALPATQEKLQALVAEWIDDLQARSQQKSGESLAERASRIARADAVEKSTAVTLGKILLKPLADLEGVDRIYIVPDGPLASVPFAALRIPGSETPEHSVGSSKILVSRFEIVMEPSESIFQVLARSRPGAEGPHALQMAVFADAVYSSSDPRVAGSHSRGLEQASTADTLRMATEAGMAHLPRLTGSREEARAIGALNGASNTSIYLGFQAVAEAVRDRDWSQYAVIHFGAHALLNTEQPAFSGVVLTMVKPDGEPQDGVLWLNDIYNLRMPVNLVVLSGCHTANGREIPGEGLEGLSRAFFFGGARSVVGSLWSVEDRETSLLMQRFYRKLIREKLSPAAAMRRAQLATAGVASTSAPYYWAGFTVQGDGAAPLTPLP
jgi:CHAT domain-containing protein/tetratricopeptide (TPR) repeat protein